MACVPIPGLSDEHETEIASVSIFTEDLLAHRDRLVAPVGMEATGVHLMPVLYVLEGRAPLQAFVCPPHAQRTGTQDGRR